jgi:DNA replication regulator DPB11
MGAVHKFDLTSDVTHLIVGNIDTPKYKYVAKERPDVKVVLPAWVEAVRESWMTGGDTNVAALESKYRVPTFYGLKICVTGFEDREFGLYLMGL